jgi:alpha-1,4-digalacturonate transport system substrate-binding protein
MNEAEAQTQFVDASNFLPTRVDLVEEGVDYAKRSEDMNVFLQDVTRTPQEAFASAYSPEFAAAATEFLEAYAEVVAGQAELSDAMEDLAGTLGG